jgi:hypothetical protein
MHANDIIRNELGFNSVREFQRAWNLGKKLVIDDILGPKTVAAAQLSWERHCAKKGDLSEHFSARELRCKCGGELRGCKGISIHCSLLDSLEKMRALYYKNGLHVVSGYRCVLHNENINGAPRSQHCNGLAADIPGIVSFTVLKKRKWFSGYGINSNGRVVHVDRRDLVGVVSREKPSHWYY